MLQAQTTDPAIAFHIATYLDATAKQRHPNTTIYRFRELDVVREAALIHVALTSGYIERIPDQVFLPLEIWNKCIDLISELTT
jgi:hypothetical protein